MSDTLPTTIISIEINSTELWNLFKKNQIAYKVSGVGYGGAYNMDIHRGVKPDYTVHINSDAIDYWEVPRRLSDLGRDLSGLLEYFRDTDEADTGFIDYAEMFDPDNEDDDLQEDEYIVIPDFNSLMEDLEDKKIFEPILRSIKSVIWEMQVYEKNSHGKLKMTSEDSFVYP